MYQIIRGFLCVSGNGKFRVILCKIPACLCTCTFSPGESVTASGCLVAAEGRCPFHTLGLWSLPGSALGCGQPVLGSCRFLHGSGTVLGGFRHLPALWSSAATYLHHVGQVESTSAFSDICLSRAFPHLPPQKIKGAFKLRVKG